MYYIKYCLAEMGKNKSKYANTLSPYLMHILAPVARELCWTKE